MRLFIAVNFDESTKKYILNMQETVKKFSRSGNFTRPENIHLTVRFIGETEKDYVEDICFAMDEAVSKFRSFNINLGGIGFFPRGEKSIVWTAVNDIKPLQILYSRLEKSLGKQGFAKSRQSFSPHITLAREVSLKKSYDEIKSAVGSDTKIICVKSIDLMESVRNGSKLIYKKIYSKELIM